jgi:RNA polymerase sigma-70 factor (ECF subfamily)
VASGRSIERWRGQSEAGSLPPSADDAALVAAALRERAQFAVIYERYADRLFRYARLRTGSASDADDIVSQTMLTALEDLSRFDSSRGTFAGWLFAIAGRRITDQQRQRGRRSWLLIRLRGPEPLGDDVLDRLVRLDDARQVRHMLNQLSEGERELLALRYSAGLSSSEIGDALGISSGAARVRLSRLVKRLAKDLSEKEAR